MRVRATRPNAPHASTTLLELTGVATASAQQTNVNYAAIYTAASGGTLIVSGPVSASPTIALGNPVQFNPLGITVHLI